MQQYNTELVVSMVREQFKKRMHETDPDKIQQFKEEWVTHPPFSSTVLYLLILLRKNHFD